MNRLPRDCISCFQAVLLTHSEETQLSCFDLSHRESHMARNCCLHLTTSDILQSFHSYVSVFQMGSPPSWTLRWLQPPLIIWLPPCEISWVSNTHRWGTLEFLTHRKYEIIHVHCFKTLHIGVICYTMSYH